MIEGHSGCAVTLQDGLINKSTCGTPYSAERLVLQIEKQKYFNLSLKNEQIIVPSIIKEEFSNGYSVQMEYFRCSNIIQYLHKAGKEQLDCLVDSICGFIDFCLLECSFIQLDRKVIIDKFDSIEKPSGLDKQLQEYIEDEIRIPVGICHGDLTLSNILLKPESGQIVLIDFLDSFVESPIIDIAKIRQDTKHGWSSFIYLGKHDKIKTKLSLQYLDDKMTERFNKYDFYKHYKLFQFMNLVRIIPYAKETKTLDFLMREICSL